MTERRARQRAKIAARVARERAARKGVPKETREVTPEILRFRESQRVNDEERCPACGRGGNAGLTLPEIYVALHPLTPGQVRNLLLQARIWALQNNVHMGRVATSPIRDEDGEPIVERKPLPDVSINSIAQNHPEGHWAWVVTRITDTYGDAAVAKYMGIPSGMINGWSLGGAVPSVQHRETLWRILVAAVAHSNGMDAYQMEDLHDHISSLMLANARTRT